MVTEKVYITKYLPFKLDPATSRTNLLTQWLRPPVKCCLWITEWLNRVRVTVMVHVRVSVTVVIGLWFCQHPHAYLLNVPQICSPHFTYGQWLYGMMLAVRTVRIVVYTLANSNTT